MEMKNIKIGEETHTKIKTYCAKHHCLLSNWLEELILMNLKYPVLVELLMMDLDTCHLYEKRGKTTDEDERRKLDKQIETLKEQRKTYYEKSFFPMK